MAEHELPDDLQDALKSIIDQFEKEDQAVRERQIRLWKKLEFYWAGFTKIWWSEVAHDWRIYENVSGEGDSGYYDKQINIFRAYLETVIAALSASVPGLKCIPDDADNASDISTAKGGTEIAGLVYKHIDAPLLWIKALFVYCTQGMIAAYNYTDENNEYGTVAVPKYENEEVDAQTPICPNCGQQLGDPQLAKNEEDEFDPGDDDIVIKNELDDNKILCPQCAMQVDPELSADKVTITRMTGVINKPKARQCVEVNGGLFVRVPNYARKQCDIPYLAYSYEQHYALIYKQYPDMRDKFKDLDTKITSSSGSDMYGRWGRLSPQYWGEYPQNTPTVRNWWLRPCAFETIEDDDIVKRLKKKFPDGCKVVFINEEYCESCNESLDDHWTLTYNPLSEYIHYDPLGLLLTSIQDITNDLISLTIQTIEHGVPQTFADPTVLDFKAYRDTEVTPGAIYPAKAKSGKNLAEGFFTVSTASLSREVGPFTEKINELGQFVSGALPSLQGVAQPGSSRTAAQYSMSRQQALQRLQTPWKMINFWWKNVFSKVIPAYIKDMLEDERIVKEQHQSFINVVIKRAEMDGKIGSVEVISSDALPQGIGQAKDIIMQLMQTNNPEILAAIGAPENLGVLQEALGLDDFSLPGEDDRVKQFEEIQILLQQNPINDQMPSVMPDFDVDNHKVEGDICRSWLVGDAGRQAKIDNPNGYKNVLLHMKVHIQMLQQLTAPPPQQGKLVPPKPTSGAPNATQ